MANPALNFSTTCREAVPFLMQFLPLHELLECLTADGCLRQMHLTFCCRNWFQWGKRVGGSV